MLVIDTSVLIEVERGNESVVSKLRELRKKHPENISITSAVYAEILFGYIVKNKKFPQEIELLDILEFDKRSAEIFARKKRELEVKGTMIPIFDLITASCTIANKMVFVTFDNHFKEVQGLQLVILTNE